MEKVEEGQPFSVIVDYAHTEDSLAQLLDAVREVAKEGSLPSSDAARLGPDQEAQDGRRGGEGQRRGNRDNDNPKLRTRSPSSGD
jgi:hypothetical protein